MQETEETDREPKIDRRSQWLFGALLVPPLFACLLTLMGLISRSVEALCYGALLWWALLFPLFAFTEGVMHLFQRLEEIAPDLSMFLTLFWLGPAAYAFFAKALLSLLSEWLVELHLAAAAGRMDTYLSTAWDSFLGCIGSVIVSLFFLRSDTPDNEPGPPTTIISVLGTILFMRSAFLLCMGTQGQQPFSAAKFLVEHPMWFESHQVLDGTAGAVTSLASWGFVFIVLPLGAVATSARCFQMRPSELRNTGIGVFLFAAWLLSIGLFGLVKAF